MKFVFSNRFYLLLIAGAILLLATFAFVRLGWFVLAFDVLLIVAAIADYFLSRRLAKEIEVTRTFQKRPAIGDETPISLHVANSSTRTLLIKAKDEIPAEMILGDEGREATMQLEPNSVGTYVYTLTPPRRGHYEFGATAVRFLSRLGLVWCQASHGKSETIKVYPNIRRVREIELRALGTHSFLAIQRKAVRRGEGREFESLRDYVAGDEMRNISWTATARRSKLTSVQHQIERDQTVMIALDAGRLMTGRIDNETKFETALHASLALMSACSRAGDNCGIIVFGRRVIRYLPPKRGVGQMDAALETLVDLEPQLVESSYSRAFQFISSNTNKRAFVVILTDVIDKDSSSRLLEALPLLRPRHLPLVATIGDRDLNASVSSPPKNEKELFLQSAAEELLVQRGAALLQVEALGGLALDVTTQTLATELLESYIRVKVRGLL
ncbi:MAG: DUF58 domain-containing protein [Acidobacteria bacterium ACB1]|nr:DUF58 domain-containing protein [Acidobacteria bacterium ACB1]